MNSPDSKSQIRLLLLLLLVSLGANVWQAFTVRKHFAGSHGTKPSKVLADAEAVQRVASLQLEAVAGGLTRSVDFPRERPLLIYVVRADCVWCDRNLGSARRLLSDLEGRYDVLVALHPLSQELGSEEKSKYEQLAAIAGSEAQLLLLDRSLARTTRGTPATIVISSLGEVQALEIGAYSGSVKRSLEKLLGSTLQPIRK